jgi:thiamine kinase-like enzyme
MITIMNSNHLTQILNNLDLGALKGEPKQILGSRGGAKIWKVKTQSQSYAIKQLSQDLDVKNKNIIAKYELSENISAEFSKLGITSVTALNKNNKHLFVFEDKGYLVYPWIEGYTLDRNEVSEFHAIKIAEIIAKLHTAQLTLPDLKPQRFDIYSTATLVDAINKSIEHNCTFAATLNDHHDTLINVNEQYQAIIPILKQEAIVTHGDIDQLNVIWISDDQPMLIDWESARLMNPTREIVRSSLSWSGIGAHGFTIEIYQKMIKTYLQYGGMYNANHTNAALKSLYGSMINWILYNIHAACNNAESNSMANANNEIISAISNIKTLYKLIPRLCDIQ